MFTYFDQSGENKKFLFEEARVIYKHQEAKEKKGEKVEAQEEVKPEESFEARKAQARQEVESIYRNDKYAPYKLNELPPDFQAHLRGSFAEWVAANVDDYDKDKNSGIDAAEYETFRVQLNEKVSGVLDRLVGAKEERRQEAVAEKESAEAAKERQERLKYQDISRIDPGNLIAPEELAVADPVRGLVTELFKYQEDWQREVKQFQMFAVGDFVQTMSRIQKASEGGGRRGIDAIAASSRNLQPWLEDTPEVKSAKAAREKAIADMQKRIEEMKKRQKDRQKRGDKLNAAPEAWRKKRHEVYEKAREDMRKKQEEAQEARRKNVAARQRAEKARKALEEKREEAQQSFNQLAARTHEFESQAQKAREDIGAIAAAPQTGEGGVSPEAAEELAKRAEAAIDPRLIELRRQTATRQKHLVELLTERGKIDDEISQRNNADATLRSTIEKIQATLGTMDEVESKEMQAIDSVDEGIADTVLSIGVGNEQIVEQAQMYLKQLSETQVRGQGVIDSIGAGVLGVPGVEKAWNWTKKTASNEWEFIKHDSVMGPIVSIIGYMGEGWVKAWDGIGAGFTWVGEALHLPQAWEWMSHASEHLSIGTPLSSKLGWLHQSNLPSGLKTFLINFAAAGDAIADTITGGGLGTVVEVFAGVTEGGKDIVQGLGMLVQDPFRAMGGIKEMINHPGMLLDSFIQRDKWGHESASKIIGRGIIEVWTTLTGGAAVSKGLARAKYARNIEKLSRSKAFLAGLKEGAIVWVQEWQQLLATLFRDIPVAIFKAPGSLLKTIAHGGKPAARAAKEAEAVFPLVRRKPKKAARAEPPPPPSARRAKTTKRPPPPSARRAKASEPPPPPSARRAKGERVKMGERAMTIEEQVAPTLPSSIPTVGMQTVKRLASAVAKSEVVVLLKRTAERAKKIREIEEAVMSRVVGDRNFGSVIEKLGGHDEYLRRLDALPDAELEMLLASVSDLDAVLFERVLRRQFDEFTTMDGRKVRYYVGTHINSGGFGSVDEVAFHFAGETRLQRGAVKRVKSKKQLEEQVSSVREFNFYHQSRERIFHNEKLAASAVMGFEDSRGLLRPRAVSEIGGTHILIYDHILPSFPGVGNDAGLKFRVRKGESAANTFRFLDEALEGLQRVHDNGFIYLDFKADQVFVGRPAGSAGKAADAAVLGDLSLIHWTDLVDLELRRASGNRYAVIKRKKGQSVAESTQMGITPNYFSAAHLQKLIDEAKRVFTDLEARGIDPTTVERCPISANHLAVADKHQIAVTIDDLVSILIRKGKIPTPLIDKFTRRVDELVAKLKSPDDPITITEVRAEFTELQRMLGYAEANIDLPAIQA